MDRLQKKCVVASTGLHLLLVLVLLVGPGFLSAPSKIDDPVVSDFIPSKLIDGLSGGGNPKAGQPAPPPRQDPQPEPPRTETQKTEPVKQPLPEPEPAKPLVKPPVRIEIPDPEALPDPPKNTHKKPQVVLTPTVRNPEKKPSTKTNSLDVARKDEKRLAGLRELATQFKGAAGTIGKRLAPGISIESGDYGPGGGGPAAMNYATFVKKVYEEAWFPPDDVDKDDAITKVTVTIARDGSVSLSRIIGPSGDSRVDASVRTTLDRVKFIAPFPEGARDKERTYTINFNLRAKRGTG